MGRNVSLKEVSKGGVCWICGKKSYQKDRDTGRYLCSDDCIVEHKLRYLHYDSGLRDSIHEYIREIIADDLKVAASTGVELNQSRFSPEIVMSPSYCVTFNIHENMSDVSCTIQHRELHTAYTYRRVYNIEVLAETVKSYMTKHRDYRGLALLEKSLAGRKSFIKFLV